MSTDLEEDNHRKIVQDYFKWITPKNLKSSDVSLELFNITVGSERAETFPVDPDIQIKFCKQLLSLIDKDINDEICDKDELSELLYNKVGDTLTTVKTESFRTYFISQSSVSLKETRSFVSAGTTGKV